MNYSGRGVGCWRADDKGTSLGGLTRNSLTIETWLKKMFVSKFKFQHKKCQKNYKARKKTHSDGKCAFGKPTTVSKYALSTPPSTLFTDRLAAEKKT